MIQTDRALVFIIRNPGTFMKDLANAVFPQANRLHGLQHTTSKVIERLRKLGFINDVAERCPHCHQATTRGSRNVPLIVTHAGIEHIAALSV